jgi:hypothetical protein
MNRDGVRHPSFGNNIPGVFGCGRCQRKPMQPPTTTRITARLTDRTITMEYLATACLPAGEKDSDRNCSRPFFDLPNASVGQEVSNFLLEQKSGKCRPKIQYYSDDKVIIIRIAGEFSTVHDRFVAYLSLLQNLFPCSACQKQVSAESRFLARVRETLAAEPRQLPQTRNPCRAIPTD